MDKKQRHINKLVKRLMSKGIRYYHKFNEKGYEKAIEMFSKAIELDPNNANAYKSRGCCYFDTEPDKAIEDLTKAIELKPNYAKAYEIRACCYSYHKNKPKKAISDYFTILKYQPNHVETYLFLGHIFSDNGEYDSSIQAFSKAIELSPESYIYYMYRGQMYIKIQDYNNAITDFFTAINSDEWNTKSVGYGFLAKIYSKLKDYNKSVEFYTKAIEILKKYSYYEQLIKCYKHRSEAYLLLGEKEKADMDLKLLAESKLKQKEREEIIPF